MRPELPGWSIDKKLIRQEIDAERRLNVFPHGKKVIYREIGFCEAVRHGDVIYTAGQVGWESSSSSWYSAEKDSRLRLTRLV